MMRNIMITRIVDSIFQKLILWSKQVTKQHKHVFVTVNIYLSISYKFLTNSWGFRHRFLFTLDFACIGVSLLVDAVHFSGSLRNK